MKEGKKVLFIHHGSAFGGAPMSLLYTALGIMKHGFIPEVALIQPSLELHKLYNENGIKTHELVGFPRYFYLSSDSYHLIKPLAIKKIGGVFFKYRSGKKKLKELIDRVKPDIIHLNSVVLVAAARILRKMNQPYVWHVREYGPRFNDFRISFIRKEMLSSEKIIFLSIAEQRSWLGNNDHGIVVNNFVDLSSFDRVDTKAYSREELGVASKFTILYVGGLNLNKGPDLLLEVLDDLKKRGVDFLCLMPGAVSKREASEGYRTDFEERLINKIEELGLSNTCCRLPFTSDIKKYYAASDVLLFPAKFPHFARPVVEASAMRIPVIVNDLEPLDELVINGETGFLTSADPKEIADKVLLLSQSPELRERMGEKGRKFAEEKFDANKQSAKIAAYYKE